MNDPGTTASTEGSRAAVDLDDTGGTSRSTIAPIAAGVVLMLVLTIGFGVLFWTIAKPPAPERLTFTIPAGTDLKITTLQPIDVIPAEIRLRQGGSITLINQDSVSFQFGTLSVGAGQTVTKTFPEVGTFRNTCRLTPGQEVLITVY